MSKKVLYFEGAGCTGTQVNDVENCRIRTAFINNEVRRIYLELSTWGYDFENIYICFCHYITPYKDDCNESKLGGMNQMTKLKYTEANILKLVNEKCNCNFESMEVLPNYRGYRVHEETEHGFGKVFLMDDIEDITKK